MAIVIFSVFTVLIFLYGVIRKRSKIFLLISAGLVILSVAMTLYWNTPTYFSVSDIDAVKVEVLSQNEYILLDEEEKAKLIELLEDIKLYRGARQTMLFADENTYIRITGSGLAHKYSPTNFNILHVNPNFSFAELNHKKYRFKIDDVKAIENFLNDLKINKK